MSDTDRPDRTQADAMAKLRERQASDAASRTAPADAESVLAADSPRDEAGGAERPSGEEPTAQAPAAAPETPETPEAPHPEGEAPKPGSDPDETLRQIGDLRDALREELAREPQRQEEAPQETLDEPPAHRAAPEERASAPPAPSPTPPSRPASGRGLAFLGLALSLLLPAALYLHLRMAGVLDRDDGRVAALESSVAALRAAPRPPAQAPPEVTRADLDRLSARLADLEKRLAADEARPPPAASPGAAPSVGIGVADLEAVSRDAKEALTRAKAAEEASRQAAELAGRLAAVEAKIAALDKRLAAAEAAAPARSSDNGSNAASVLVMARAVSADLANGTPYAGELDALSRLGVDAKLVEALRPFAEKGAPSPSSLADAFEAELNQARAKVADSERPSGFWGWIAGLVHARHVGSDEPGTPAAAIEAALARGDLGAAADALDGLPVFEKGATPVTSARIRALAEAYAASRRISDAALEAIRRSGAGNGG